MPAIRIAEFDVWRPGYGLATVRILRANSTTLANVYGDEALTIPANNPQLLLEKTDGGLSYGKFVTPIYTEQAYELQIDSIDTTGITRPALTDLVGEDASEALVTAEDGSVPVPLAAHLARQVDVRDHGAFLPVGSPSASAAANAAAIQGAIGACTAAGGGTVRLPAGTYEINPFAIPLNVVVEGYGRGVTILQCAQGGRIVQLGGDRSGLRGLTLDGLSKPPTSVGVYWLGRNQVVLDQVEVRRFETGLHGRGGELLTARGLYVSDCSFGARLHGDDDAGGGGGGTSLVGPSWIGGRIEFCSIAGLELKRIDLPCIEAVLEAVHLFQNIGAAVRIEGARSTALRNCIWDTNTINLEVLDAAPVTLDSTVQDLLLDGGTIKGGEIKMNGALGDVAFRRVDLDTVSVSITTPGQSVMVEDCTEKAVTLFGATTAWLRSHTNRRGASAGVTTGAAATKAWAFTLRPGQRAYCEARVIGRGRDNTSSAFYHFAVSTRRPAAVLSYEVQTGQFTVGNRVTGTTSGASGRIVADDDLGTTGNLSLQDVVGAFLDNELITDGTGGSATVNAELFLSDVVLEGTVTAIRTAVETVSGWDATFVANGPEIELRVTGEAAKTIEWTADVDVVTA